MSLIQHSAFGVWRSLHAILPLLLLTGSSPARAEGGARIVRVRGDAVTVRLRSALEDQPARVGMGLEPGDEVATGEASQADILLGAQTVLSMREGSRLRLPGSRETPQAEVALAVGALLFKLKKLGATPFRVRAPHAVAAVRGTEFAVAASSPGSPTLVGVFDEGRVAARTDAGEVELAPGQETVCRSGAAPEPPRPLTALRKYRAAMRELRGRLAALQREYRRLPREKLRELRRRRPAPDPGPPAERP